MDEEQNNKSGSEGNLGKTISNNAKSQLKKQMIKTVIKALPIILAAIKVIVIAFIIMFVAVRIDQFLNGTQSSNSRKSEEFAVAYAWDNNDSEEIAQNRIVIDPNNVENGAYKLKFEFKDENGNVYNDEQALNNIKKDLLKKKSNLDLSKFSDIELKVIGTLMYNGLQVEKYNEEQLKALFIFVKADIASNNFDLRSSEEIGKEVTLEDMENSDYVYGTIQAHRTRIVNTNQGPEYDEIKLEYIPYGSEDEEGTFCYMVKQKDTSVINKFSINDKGNFVIAKNSTYETTNTYHPYGKENQLLSDEDKKKIPEEIIKPDKLTEVTISAKDYNYKQNIKMYNLNYGILSDLLIVTENTDFCKELAEIAFNSKIVINAREEKNVTYTKTVMNYKQTSLLYDYVKYEVSGQKGNVSSTWERILTGDGSPSSNKDLQDKYGWDPNLDPVKVSGGSSGGTMTYEWTFENVNYKLEFTSTISSSRWTLFKENQETTYQDLETETNIFDSDDGELIKNKHDDTLEEDYTDDESFDYTIVTEVNSEINTYKLEISDIDTWITKYKQEYNNPTQESAPNSGTTQPIESLTEYEEDLVETLKTTNNSQINNENHVKDFITKREEQYKQKYEADKAKCDVQELTVKRRLKTTTDGEYYIERTSYKFGKENADTTQIQFKNVEFVNNTPSFTNQDENGFLYIYDKYRTSGVDLFLENDSEELLYELLGEESQTSNILKYLLFVYDGIDRGVTDFSLDIFKAKEMKDIVVGSSALLKKYIRSWEHSTPPPTNADGTCYIIESDGAGHPTVGYGVDIENSGYKSLFIEAGYPTTIGGEVPIEFVDAIEDMVIENAKEQVEAEVSGLNLTGYQINALVSRAYNCGVYGAVGTNRGNPSQNFVESYIAYWNEETDNKFEQRDNNADFNNELYIQYMSKPVTSEGQYMAGLGRRRESEWILFQTGYYNTLNEWHMDISDLLAAADKVHIDEMSWTYSTNKLFYNDIEKSLNNPDQVTCCATYVACALYTSGYLTEEQINNFTNYNYVPTLYDDLEKLGWEQILSYDDLEAGDIVITQNDGTFAHIQIYAGNDTWYNAGSTEAIQRESPYSQGDWARTWFQIGLRPQPSN